MVNKVDNMVFPPSGRGCLCCQEVFLGIVALELALDEGTEVANRKTCYGENEPSNEEIGKGRPKPMAPATAEHKETQKPALCFPEPGPCTRAGGAVSPGVQFMVAYGESHLAQNFTQSLGF